MDPLSCQTVQDLVDLIQDGEAYVSVHTSQNPSGEIRGQIDYSCTYSCAVDKLPYSLRMNALDIESRVGPCSNLIEMDIHFH